MSITAGAENLEKKIRKMLDGLFGRGASRQPLELRRLILDEIADRAEPIGGGKKIFPFNKLMIHLLAPEDEQRSILKVAFVADHQLENDIRERLGREAVSPPEALEVRFNFVKEQREEWANQDFHISYGNVQRKKKLPPSAAASVMPRASIFVLKGKATKKRYAVNRPEFHVGRGTEIRRLSDGVIVRHNDLAFDDDDQYLELRISRSHADIFFDKESDEFRIRDMNSEYGTSIIRNGATIVVPKGERRGVKLRSRDEIELGRARIRFDLKELG